MAIGGLASAVYGQSASTPAGPERGSAASTPAAIMPLAAQFPQRILDAVDLMGQGRYGDAADVANDLCAADPDSPPARELRGAIELWVGDTNAAQADFEAAEQQQSDAASHLGLAECAMRSHDPAVQQSTIVAELRRASTCSNVTAAELDDLSTLEAYYGFLDGDDSAARGLSAATGGELRKELIALEEVHTSNPLGPGDLAKFLSTASGVPRVREDDGVRLIYTRSPAMLEPAITDPTIQSMFIARVAQPRQDDPAADNASPPVWGDITLAPKEPNPATSSVVYSIDGSPVADITSKPYSYDWNTRLMVNGPHTVTIESRMDGGVTLGREEHEIRVVNPTNTTVGTSRANTDASTYAQVDAGLWRLLVPRPSRAVAEMAMARIKAAAGAPSDADTHNLIATALDPWLTSITHTAVRTLPSVRLTSQHLNATDGVWWGDTNKKWVALTFDDGPNAKTAALLDAVDRAHVHVTFFIVGSRAEERPEIVRRMAASGDDVENHSYTHPNIAQCLPPMVRSEILRTNIIIRSLTGRYPRFFRPPGGNASRTLANLADGYGLELAFWSLDALKLEEASSKTALVDYVLSHIHPGSIVLMHNGPDVTTAAIPDLVAGLRARGYQLVTLREIVR